MFTTVFLGILLHFVLQCKAENPVVEITQGSLRGRTQIDRNGGSFYSFQKIPFAQPPVGRLRFKAPVPAGGWTGIRDATEDLPKCFQRPSLSQLPSDEEDCLYLNVYTNELPVANTTLKPVMVFIHGGGFIEGSARQDLYGPEFLITKDIVLVVINYRLGLFGSFSVDDESLGVPGNAGLKDQVMALKWVRDNIERFGGNSDDVTIFGESAGGASVHLHILSPMSTGLFKKAIIQSGVAIGRGQLNRNNGLSVARTLGIQTENLDDMLQSLQDVPAERINTAQRLLSLTNPGISSPIVEIPTNEPAFLAEAPLALIESGNYNDATCMIGYNDAEAIFMELIWRSITGEAPIIRDFFAVIPSELGIVNGTEAATYLSEKIKRFYHGDDEPTTEDTQPFIQLNTDVSFGFPSFRAAFEHVKTAKSPVYFYRFSADTKLNFIKRMNEITATHPGASHADELGYLFKNLNTVDIEENSVEDLALDRVVTLWTNFATYGTPTPGNFTFKLEPVSEETFNYLDIGTHQSVASVNPDEENIAFWVGIYAEFFRPDTRKRHY